MSKLKRYSKSVRRIIDKRDPRFIIVLFALVGVFTLIYTKAATPTAAIESEAGSRSGGVSLANSAQASGGSAVKFGGGVGNQVGLPSGVTLQQIDGGAGYYSKWSNSFPSDQNLFPLGIWAENFSDDSGTRTKVDRYSDMGINMFVEIYGSINTNLGNYLRDRSIYTIGGGPYEVAQRTTDEPDWRGCQGGVGIAPELPSYALPCATLGSASGAADTGPITPAVLQRWSDGLRSRDTTRPIFGQFTHIPKSGLGTVVNGTPVCQEYWTGSESTARAYAKSADILSYDIYVLTGQWLGNHADCTSVWSQGDYTKNLRRLSDYSKPVWAFIETSYVTADNNYRPTPADVNSEVWHSIINGARGIEYFNHDFKSGTTAVLLDSRFQDIATQVKSTNALIKSLAPVINSPFANGFVSTTSPVSIMSKYHNDSTFYIFAASRTKNNQNATFSVKAGTSVEVVGENRIIPITNGTFTDNFASQTAVHIYKVQR